MRSRWISHHLALVVLILSIHTIAVGAAKVHVMAFRKWISVQCFSAYNAGDTPITMKVRALLVHGRVKEYTMGAPPEVTGRLFVARRIFRVKVNDSLPDGPQPSGVRSPSVSRRFDRGHFLGDGSFFHLRAGDQNDRQNHDRAARENEAINPFVKNQPA